MYQPLIWPAILGDDPCRLGAPLDDLEPEWLSGYDLARGAGVLLHDCQYTDDEYPAHLGWGHVRTVQALADLEGVLRQDGQVDEAERAQLDLDTAMDTVCGPAGRLGNT